jgi:carboxymethylenebutenolidase
MTHLTRFSLAAALVLISAGGRPDAQARPSQDPHAGHGAVKPGQVEGTNDALPPAAEHAVEALKNSPRHHEWVDVKVPGSSDTIKTFVAYPERKDKAGIVVVIHEIFGLSDWIRAVADQLAQDGFIAVAPDLLSGKGPNRGGTDELGDKVTQVIRTLTPEEVVTRLNAVRDHGLKLPAANGRSATIGFCWGGQYSFHYASAQPALNGAVVYYGPSPSDPAAYTRISAPVLGLYGQDDARVNATIPTAEAEMGKAGKSYEKHVFVDAGHGFLRQQSGTQKVPKANMKATELAWPLTLEFLRKQLK